MSEKEYIERGALIAEYNRVHVGAPGGARKLMVDAPAADVVSKGVYEQVKWERDMAMQQLEEHGIPFGAKADVVEVVYGEWIDKPTGAYGRMQSWCSACGKHSGIGGIESNRHKPYCPNCGAKMDGERKEQT